MLLVARDRETARALGHEFACHEVSKLYLAAGYDVSFSSSHLPRVGIVYSDIVSVCDAKGCRSKMLPISTMLSIPE